MRQAHPVDVALGGVQIEAEGRALHQHRRTFREDAAAQLGSLQVGEDADGAAHVLLDLADDAVTPRDVGLVAVAHVEAEDVGACLEQRPDDVVLVRRGAQGGDDLHVALSSERSHLSHP